MNVLKSEYQKFSYSFLYLLIPLLILVPKSQSELFGIIPTRLFLISVFLLLFFIDVVLGKIQIKRINFGFLLVLVGLFLLSSLPSVFVSQRFIISLYTYIKFLIFFLFFFAVLHLQLNQKQYKGLSYVLIVTLLILLLAGIYEYQFSTSLFTIGIEQIMGAKGRIQLTFFNTIYYGIFLNVSLAFALYMIRIVKGKWSYLIALIIALIFVNMTLTFTRTSYLVFWGIIGLSILLDFKLLKKLSFIISVGIILFLMFFNQTFSTFARYSFELPVRYLSNIDELLLLLPSFSSGSNPIDPSPEPIDPTPEPTDPVYPDYVEFSVEEINLKQIGVFYDFDVLFSPEAANQKEYTVTSSNPEIVEVLNRTRVFIHQFGEATLFLQTPNQLTASINVIVDGSGDYIDINQLSIGKSSMRFYDLGSYKLVRPTISPSNATDQHLIWTSSNPDVATVDRFGMVFSVGYGEATINASTLDRNFSSNVIVKVEKEFIDYSALHRKEFSIIANQIASDHLYTGVGFGTYIDYMNSSMFTEKYPDYIYPKTHPHSAMVLLYAETGIISVSIMILILFYFLLKGCMYFIRFFRDENPETLMSRYLPGLLIGFVMVNLFAENAIYDTQVFPYFLLIIALGFSYLESQTSSSKKILAIASQGGHIFELLQISEVFEASNFLVITEKAETTLGLRMKYGKNIKFLVYETRKNLFRYAIVFSWNIVRSLFIYLTFMPQYIVTTGTHTAVPMCFIGKLFGSRIIYIETMANINSKSLSGTLVYPIADLFIVQWKEMLHLYKKAVWGGLIIK